MISVRLDVTSTCMDGTSETTAYVNNCGGSPIDPMIYPNPASDELTIELNHIEEGVRKEEKIVELSLFDYRGTELYKQTTSEDKVVLNVRHLKNGFYYLHIRYEGALIRKQIREVGNNPARF
ncbi:T9SS type A sorting domain-containing protein [Anditalea andensis]|uniref:Secretion system C-terminal sorting domain-containing protein n=1 Tax=Anditalea andensis TaxID=1048983 RepID=A0A074KXZ3_9BACT|nr:T9SS type A sorting domain-containing protein [Anditalea andensis]KEO73819.1 hypothetical protein EL17_09955 [Anditalea andensis]